MRKIIIHLGCPRTATTTLQKSIFPNLKNFKFIKLYSYKSLLKQIHKNFEKTKEDFRKQIYKKNNYIISDELFLAPKYGASLIESNLINLKHFLKNFKIKPIILVTTRNSFDYFNSYHARNYHHINDKFKNLKKNKELYKVLKNLNLKNIKVNNYDKYFKCFNKIYITKTVKKILKNYKIVEIDYDDYNSDFNLFRKELCAQTGMKIPYKKKLELSLLNKSKYNIKSKKIIYPKAARSRISNLFYKIYIKFNLNFLNTAPFNQGFFIFERNNKNKFNKFISKLY